MRRSFGPLHLSRKLAELLEYPAAELFKRLRAEPLCRVVAADREGLTAALIRSRVGGLPLRQACRMRTRSGQVLWIFLEAAWQPQEDGGDLLYIACSDVTRKADRGGAAPADAAVRSAVGALPHHQL